MEAKPAKKAKSAKNSAGDSNTYESLMAELTEVMKTMENGQATLEQQLAGYEQGMLLCAKLEEMLRSAEERITIINQAGQEEGFE